MLAETGDRHRTMFFANARQANGSDLILAEHPGGLLREEQTMPAATKERGAATGIVIALARASGHAAASIAQGCALRVKRLFG